MNVALLLALALSASAALAGCTGAGQCGASTHANGLDFGCQVANKTDTMTYTFHNGLGGASVNMGSQIASGTVTVKIQDGAGKEVFARTYSGASQSGDSTTRSGTPGTWTVLLRFQDATGQIGLDVNGRAPSPF